MAREPVLAARLEVRIRDLEKQMAKAQDVTGRGMSQIERRTAEGARRIEASLGGAFSNFGKGLLGGIAAGGLGALVGQLGAVAKGIASVGDEAKRAGLSAKAFQEFAYVARQNRIGVDALTDGFKELALRADEWIVTGSGPAAEAFQRLGYSAAELKEKLKDPSALFTEIIGKLGQLDKAAQIRIADEVFGGTAGERFVELIGQGADGIRETIDEANRLGLVMDDQLIARAAELDRKFDAVASTVGTALKTAIVEAAGALQNFFDSFREFESRATTSLETRFAELNTRRGQLMKQRGTLEDSALALIGRDAATELAAVEADLARVAAELRQRAIPKLRQELLANQPATGLSPAAGGGVAAAVDKTVDSFSRLNDAVSRYVDNVVAAESGGDAGAKNPLSSATGLGQFIESTWLDLFKRHFPDRAQGMADATILALRSDAEISRSLITAYAAENAALLRQAGIAVNEAALHLSHFLGPGGAIDVLKAAPGTPVSQVLGADAIAANPSILGGGATVDDVIAYAEKRAAANATVAASNRDLAASYGEVEAAAGGTAAATEQVAQAQAQLGQIAANAMQGFANALADGKLEAHELLQILTQIVQQVMSMPGGLSGLLSIFTGGGGSIPAGGVTAGGIGLWAKGGRISGPGTGTSDSILARLSDGEYVVRAKQARKHGALLEAINRDDLPGFAKGGWPTGGRVERGRGFNI